MDVMGDPFIDVVDATAVSVLTSHHQVFLDNLV